MATRVTLVTGGREWSAQVSGNHVAIAGDPDVVVREDDRRLIVAAPEGDVRGVALRHGDSIWVSVAGEVFEFLVGAAARRARGGAHDEDGLSAPMPATVVRIAVKVGDAVRAGDVLIALEAMKMELPIRAPADGTVTAIHCREGELVQPGVPLVEVGGRGTFPQF